MLKSTSRFKWCPDVVIIPAGKPNPDLRFLIPHFLIRAAKIGLLTRVDCEIELVYMNLSAQRRAAIAVYIDFTR